jgi:hypothetical protein
MGRHLNQLGGITRTGRFAKEMLSLVISGEKEYNVLKHLTEREL